MNDKSQIHGGNTPAFPSSAEFIHFPGMCLRAYFAGQAMQGILTAVIGAQLHSSAQTPPDDIIAKWAVASADALIAELNHSHV